MNTPIKEFIIPKDYVKTDIIASIALLRALNPESANSKITITDNKEYIDNAKLDPSRVLLGLGREVSIVNNNFDTTFETYYFDDLSEYLEVELSIFGLIYQNYGYEYIKQVLLEGDVTHDIYSKVYRDIVMEIDGQNSNLTQHAHVPYRPSGFLDSLIFHIYNLFPEKYLGSIKSRWKCKTNFESQIQRILGMCVGKEEILIFNNIKGLCDEFILNFNDTIRYSEKYYSTIREEHLYVEKTFHDFIDGNKYDTIYFDRNIENSFLKLKSLEDVYNVYPDFIVYPEKDNYIVKSTNPYNLLVKIDEVIDYGNNQCKVPNLDVAEKLINESIGILI